MFINFLNNLKNNENKEILESIMDGYSVLFEDREKQKGKKLSEYNRYKYNKTVPIYRARNLVDNNFYNNDYVTLSPKFAVDHAENNHAYEEEQQQVIKALVHPNLVVDASNPGEYFYIGDTIEGKSVYKTLGDDYEGEVPNLLESDNGNEIIKIKSFKTDEGEFDIYDINKDRNRGYMFTVLKSKDGYIVRSAHVPSELQRKGIATEFYKKINEESKRKTNKPLRSTQPRTLIDGEVVHELSNDAIALWDSFVQKGLAKKLGDKNYIFGSESVFEPESGFQPFDVRELQHLNGFSKKIKYVASHLEKIGSGSARNVYKIDEDTVLKLAKNAKGVAQNNVEGDWTLHRMYPDILPELIDKDEDNLWIIKKRANKLTESQFEKITGFKFKDFAKVIHTDILNHTTNISKEKLSQMTKDIPNYEDILDEEFVNEIVEMAVSFDMPSGDLERISTYGEIDNKPVVTDAGLTNTVLKEHYNK